MHLAQHTTGRNPSAPADEARLRAPRWLVVLAALAVVTALVLGGFALRAHQAIAQNTSLVDRRATADATRAVSDVVTKAFSFDYGKPGETGKVAAERLRGQALAEHRRLLQPVEHQAAAQKLVVTATVKQAGVIALEDGEARVLVLADQFAVRAGTDQYSGGPAQLEVTAHREDGSWNITGIRLL